MWMNGDVQSSVDGRFEEAGRIALYGVHDERKSDEMEASEGSGLGQGLRAGTEDAVRPQLDDGNRRDCDGSKHTHCRLTTEG